MRWVIVAPIVFLLLTAACSVGGEPQESEVIGEPLEPEIIGRCDVGMNLRAGEACEIYHYDSTETFWVKQDGSGCIAVKTFRALPTTTPTLHQMFDTSLYTSSTKCRDSVLNSPYSGRLTKADIDADKNDDGSWTVVRFTEVIQ